VVCRSSVKGLGTMWQSPFPALKKSDRPARPYVLHIFLSEKYRDWQLISLVYGSVDTAIEYDQLIDDEDHSISHVLHRTHSPSFRLQVPVLSGHRHLSVALQAHLLTVEFVVVPWNSGPWDHE
jgi:hypothetical protein